jgi:hypothetical protein
MADRQQREEQHGQDADDRRLVRRALRPGLAGLNDEAIQAPPLIHVGNFEERDPPIFRGLPHEDVVEWIHQFQRVSAFNQWGAQQQLSHIEFILEGVAARWLSGLNPRPNTIEELIGALQAAFRHHNYAMELESRLRARKQGPDEPVMSYCYDMIYLCSRVDPDMPEERKIQFIFQNMDSTLMQRVFPQMDQLTTTELFRRLQAHCQASLIAERSIPVNNATPTSTITKKEDIEKLVRDEVSKSLDPIVRKLEQVTRAMGTAGGSGFNPRTQTPEKGRTFQWRNQDRPNKRTIDGRPICNNCGVPGHIARNCPKGKGCFNCGDPGHFSRQCPKRKQEGGPRNKQEPNDSSQKPSNPPAGQSN